jgi:cytochrome c553
MCNPDSNSQSIQGPGPQRARALRIAVGVRMAGGRRVPDGLTLAGSLRMAGFALALSLAGAVSTAAAAEGWSVEGYAKRLAVGVCGSCHGTRGNSIHPKFPRLAGQNAHYLAAQLKSFRGQTRGDPDAISYMWGMAGQLDDATIEELARYYSGQAATARAGGALSAEASRGREIYEHGIASEGVPACAACHGPDGRGLADFPRLAGQHSQYVIKQLASFQSNMRDVAVMHGVAQNLNEAQMRSVAAYLETLP